jgi:hypothetical protein
MDILKNLEKDPNHVPYAKPFKKADKNNRRRRARRKEFIEKQYESYEVKSNG